MDKEYQKYKDKGQREKDRQREREKWIKRVEEKEKDWLESR